MPTDHRGLVEQGRRAWALLGILLVAGVVLLVLAQVSLVVFSLLVALFPAALLAPLAAALRRRGLPSSVAALVPLVAVFAALALAVRFIAPAVAAEVPAFVAAAEQAGDRAEQLLQDAPLPVDVEGVDDLVERALDALGGDEGLAGRGVTAATALVDVLTAFALTVVAVFFYLRDGRRLWSAVLDAVPARRRQPVDEIGERVWWTLGAYLRGQLLVALVDAVFIGLGLVLLGVPLALPLAVVVFLGGLFPIVGAFASGLLAVLVALAEGGLGTAALTLGLVVLVQQLEGNVLEPLILSKVIALHPLVVIVSITVGALTLGIVGAFLAVPFTASVARAVDHVRGRTPDAGPGSEQED